MEAELKGKQVLAGVIKYGGYTAEYEGTVVELNDDFLILENAKSKALGGSQFSKVYINRSAIYAIRLY